MESSAARLLQLRCAVQHYEWGHRGNASLVARLANAHGDDPVNPTRRYAEFWMGTHPSAPSELVDGGNGTRLLLKDWLLRNPDVLGPAVAARWEGHLPFLFKVLSVAKALSIQAHLDKKLAETLHALRPETYKDDNHKPEMAIAVTQFRALCGFVGTQELKEIFRTVPELKDLVGHKDTDKLVTMEYDWGDKVKSNLQSAFTMLMTASKHMVSEAIAKLINRLNAESEIRALTEKEQLVLSLERQYEEDVGVLAALFFNYVKLNPDEALYIDANEPHAYLSGECIECMATSDNVVRAGMTSKYRDVETLCSMLTYNQTFPKILVGIPVQPHVTRYIPPFDELEVDLCMVPQGEDVVIPSIPGPSIFLVMAGEGEIQLLAAAGNNNNKHAKEGDVFFVAAYSKVKLSAAASSSDGYMHVYRAGVNNKFLASKETSK
uniref:Uncharacterized protein n=1 Tax=Avena sativa TaxID=4498 RepID=A0ACD5U500_AVESA